MPEGAEAAEDEPWVEGVQRFIPEAASGQRRRAPRCGRLDHGIGAAAEIQEEVAPARPIEIQGDAALAGVERQPEHRTFGIGNASDERRPPPCRVALRWLDLDHIGAEVAQQLARQKSRLGGEVEDPVTVEIPGADLHAAADVTNRSPGVKRRLLLLTGALDFLATVVRLSRRRAGRGPTKSLPQVERAG